MPAGLLPLVRDAKLRKLLKLPDNFVLRSLKHAALMDRRHTGIAVSQKYIHPSHQAMEPACELWKRPNKGQLVPGWRLKSGCHQLQFPLHFHEGACKS